MRLKHYLVLILTAALLSSCSDDSAINNDDENIKAVETIFPLSIGNWWDYDLHDYDESVDGIGEKIGSFRYEVVETTTFEGKSVYILVSKGHGDRSHMIKFEDSTLFFLRPFPHIQIPAPRYPIYYDAKSDSWEVGRVEEQREKGDYTMIARGDVTNKYVVEYKIEKYRAVSFDINAQITAYFGNDNEPSTVKSNESFVILHGIGFYKMLSDGKIAILQDSYIAPN